MKHATPRDWSIKSFNVWQTQCNTRSHSHFTPVVMHDCMNVWWWMLIFMCAGISCWTLMWVSCSILWASRGGVRSPADACLWLVRLWRRATRRLTCSSSARPMGSSSNSEVFYTRARDSQVSAFGDDELKVTRFTQQYWAVTTATSKIHVSCRSLCNYSVFFFL